VRTHLAYNTCRTRLIGSNIPGFVILQKKNGYGALCGFVRLDLLLSVMDANIIQVRGIEAVYIKHIKSVRERGIAKSVVVARSNAESPFTMFIYYIRY